MDADDIRELIDNDADMYETAYRRTIYVLRKRGLLYQIGDPQWNHHPPPVAESALSSTKGPDGTYVHTVEAIGDEIYTLIIQRIRRDHGLLILEEKTFAGTVIARALGLVSWADVGILFYQSTRERYLRGSGEHKEMGQVIP